MSIEDDTVACKTGPRTKSERNEQIVEMAKTLRVPVIAKRLGITRNVVVGVIHRNRELVGKVAGTSKEQRSETGRAGSWRWRKGNDASVKARAAPKAKPEPKPKPKPPVEVALPAMGVPPEDAVSLEQRTGCAWPYGDKPPYLYCNLPRCAVTNFAGVAEKTAYCAGHWRMRRISAHSRIVK